MVKRRVGIRGKLLILFIGVLLIYMLLGMVLNKFFLEKYYLSSEKKYFRTRSMAIEKLINENNQESIRDIDRFEQSDGITTRVIDSRGRVIFLSNGKNGGGRIPKELEELLIEKSQSGKKESYGSASTVNERLKIYHLRDIGNNRILVLAKNMDWIKNSVEISSNFFLYTALIMLLLGIPLILLLTKVISKSLLEIREVSENVAELRFDKEVKSISGDEIGDIGKSINMMSKELKSAIDDLKIDVERKRSLVRNISHELKTPIGVIVGFAEALAGGVGTTPEKRERYHKIIVNECHNMNEMIKGLLRLSQLENNITLTNSHFKFDKILNKILDKLELKIKNKNVVIKKSGVESLIVGDEELLSIAIQNIVTNATNYVEEGGEIEVKVESIDGYNKISIFNSGSHIEESELSEIWEVFHKSDKARTRAHGGHGIGLSIVKLIVEKHQGKYGVLNRENGVEFYISLPKREDLL